MAQMDKVKFLSPIEASNIDVTGDIRVQGESIISSLETVVTKENTIKLRDGATGALMSNEYTGIIAEKYDGTNNGMLVFDSSGTAYVGDEGDLQPLATRAMDVDDNGKYAYWDSENQTLKPGLLNEKNNAVYVGDNKIITSVDSVTSAGKLTTARKISLGTGVSSTATSFNGSSDITIPVTGIKEAYLTWGGKDISGGLSAFDVSLINELSQNAFSFLSDDAITIEYSNDGGTTWFDYDTSYSKASLVTEGIVGNWYLGKHWTSGTATTDDQLRITFNKGAYFVLRKLAIYMSTNGCSNCTCTLETCKVNSTPDTWTVLKENVPISGYSGWNVLNMNVTYGGHQSWGCSIRLTFKQATAPSTAVTSANILKIYAYSGTTYSYANNYAKTGHIYTFDANQNTTFPAKVTASSFEGNATSATKATQDGAGNIITDTYVKYTTSSNVNVGGQTKSTYRLSPPETDGNGTLSSASAYFPEGIIMGGSALTAGLMTRGVCGINTANPYTGACEKENLYLNYDGTNDYKVNRQVVLQASEVGTHYGNNVYQYAAVRGDALKNYCNNLYYDKTTMDEKIDTKAPAYTYGITDIGEGASLPTG